MVSDDGNSARDGAAPDEAAPVGAGQASEAAHQAAKEAGDQRPVLTVEELEDRWRRALAELDNARKRHVREMRQAADAERRRVCLVWLPVVDNLELALEHADGEPSIVVGVRAVRDQAVALLASLGYPRDDETGVPFDPLRHEATGVVQAPDTAPGTVVKVLRPGYGRPPDGQLRPAAVLVSAKQE